MAILIFISHRIISAWLPVSVRTGRLLLGLRTARRFYFWRWIMVEEKKEPGEISNDGLKDIVDLYLPICKIRAIANLFWGESDGVTIQFTKDESFGLSHILKDIAEEIESC